MATPGIGLLLGAALAMGTASAQEPDLPWTVLETSHYRLIYPREAQPWADHLAGRLDNIRAIVSAEVGYQPDVRVDVVLLDPWRRANGFAVPIGRHPRMGVFPVSPGADSGLAWYRDWAEDLVVHEDAHLAHMLRPSRSPLWRGTLGLLGLEPITVGGPRWLYEGTATVVEGRLTGMGRPFSDMRAAWLRLLAEDGRLPDYHQLNGTEGWMTGSHAYLVGSAYLEWLESTRCPGPPGARNSGDCTVLQDLSARMTARRIRSFTDAFTGVFGDPPAVMYDRFRAELSHEALRLEAARETLDDSLWQDLPESTLGPAVSPDGSRLVAVRRVERENRLVVFSTADDPELEETWWEPHRRAVDKDPQDVLPLPPEAFPRQPEATRSDIYRQAWEPRWLPDGQGILFSSWEVDARGASRPDLFTWEPETGRERRVTRGAELSAADPHPDGSWAVAHRQVWGEHSFHRVDLATGAVTELFAVPVPHALDHPRISPDGQTLAYLLHDGGWRIVLRDLATGAQRVLPTPEGALVADPEWSADGQRILFALGLGGRIEIAALGIDDDGSGLAVLTRSRAAASAPAPTPDGRALFHLGLDSDGVDLHRVAIDWERPAPTPLEGAPPLVPPAHPAPPPPLVETEPPPARPYGMGRVEWFPLVVGGGVRVGGQQEELGLRLGDLVGRHELLVLGGWGTVPDVSGGALRFAWRGPGLGKGGSLRVEPFLLREGGRGWRAGGELSVGADRQAPRAPWSWRAGGWFERGTGWGEGGADAATGSAGQGGEALFASVDVAPWTGRGSWLRSELGLDGQAIRDMQQGVALAGKARLGLGVGVRKVGLLARAEVGHTGLDWRVGGLESSLLPDGWSTLRVAQPLLAPGALTGDWYTGAEGVLDLAGFELLARTDRTSATWDPAASDGMSQAGVRVGSQADALALARIPALDFEVGLACMLEQPGLGWDPEPCRQLADYGAWTTLRWGW